MQQNSSGQTKTAQSYDDIKRRANERSVRLTRSGQDVGAIPPPKDIARRNRADNDFRFFCETYFPDEYNLAWSDDHLRVIDKIERVVCDGETMAVAMPRGSGKTTLSQTAVIWAVITGRHKFVYLIAGTEDYANDRLTNIKTFLSTNQGLYEDYPEAICPIRHIEGEARRCTGQRYYGKRTHISWGADEVVMATIPGARCSGAVIRVAGITGNVRGALHVRANGQSIRPSLAVVDDPQTDSTAKSPTQVHERIKIINGAILGLAGPGKKMSAIIPCTVICENDLADQLLDREQNPLWQGERTKMMYSMPGDMELWNQYDEIRKQSFREGGNGKEATEFYRENQEVMDTGAKAAWNARYKEDEISAVQHAMNFYYRDEYSFYAEYQNEPLADLGESSILTVDQVAGKYNGYKKYEVPLRCQYLTMFVDVHDKLLFYVVVAWEEDFTGYVIDYGTFPQQNRSMFVMSKVRKDLLSLVPGGDRDAAIQNGLETLCEDYLSREWSRVGGAAMKIDRCFIDSGYKPEIVNNVRRKLGSVILAARGVGIRASSNPMSSYRRKPGERHGEFWYMPNVKRTREYPYVRVDVNYWKTFVHERLALEQGSRSNMTLYGDKKTNHLLFAQHIAGSEFWVRTEGQGRIVNEWKERAGNPDNHWFDCLVGCSVAASMCGCSLPVIQKEKSKGKVKFSEIQRQKRQARCAYGAS